jgi:hypothetical protein
MQALFFTEEKVMFHIVFSRINQAWFILFGKEVATASVLRVVNTKAEAESLLAEWGSK